MSDQDKSESIELQESSVPSEPQSAAPAVRVQAEVIAVDEGGVRPTNVQQMHRMAVAYFKAGMVPKSFKTPEQVFAGMQFAAELGLPMLSGLRQIAIVNGQPSIWGDLPLALVRRTGELEFINETLFTETYDPICFDNKNINAPAWGAMCKLKRRGYDAIERVFTIDDAKKAGLLSRDNVWQTYPRRMLQMKARSIALKDVFSDALMGAAIAEYDFNVMPSERDVAGVGSGSTQAALLQSIKGEVKQ
jgi:hypothetical protein